MRQASANSIKRSRGGGPLQKLPREGSMVRQVYDTLMNNKGLPVKFKSDGSERSAFDQLQNFYGLDIRYVGHKRWMLVGEWFGRVYIDYVAERIER